jgi:hypothetical protein
MTKVMQRISQSLEPMIPNLEAGESFEPLRSTVRENDQEVKTLRGAISSLGGRFLSMCSPETRVPVHKLSLLGLAIRRYRRLAQSRLADDALDCQYPHTRRRLAMAGAHQPIGKRNR